jgi:long-chain acyl-CoA synthetase
LYVTGRIKEQYKLANGKYVSPAVLEDRLKLSPFIADVMICGEDREHNVALVVPDMVAVRAWATDAEIPSEPGDGRALLEEPRLVAKIAAEIQDLSRGFRGYERIAGFALLAEGFTQQNGMLTPSLKLRRREIVARWRGEIDRLHAQTNPGVGPARRGAGA